MESEIKKICDKNNLRLTEQRKKVFGIICQSKKPIKAYDLLEEFKKIEPNAKPTTIYRNLSFLLQNDFIHKINKINAYLPCSHPNECHECYFLFCLKCNQITECCSEKIQNMIQEKAEKQKFVPKKISLEIEGICEDCSNNYSINKASS